MNNFLHYEDRQRISKLAGGINIRPEDTFQHTDRIDNLQSFLYEPGLGIFENQKRYMYTSPELTMAQRKMDVALHYSTITGHFMHIKNSDLTYDDHLIMSCHNYKKYRQKIVEPTLYPKIVQNVILDSRQGTVYAEGHDSWLIKSTNLAIKAWGIQFECMRDNSPLLEYTTTTECIRSIQMCIKLWCKMGRS